MFVVLREEAQRHCRHRVVAPGLVQAAEQGTTLLQIDEALSSQSGGAYLRYHAVIVIVVVDNT